MKKGILLLIAILSLTNLAATNIKKDIEVNYRYNDAVTFVEKGIEFHVFLNGNFNFNTLNKNNIIYSKNSSTQIRKDNFGNIKQIGNTVINYSNNGKVTGIGNVPIRYRSGQLTSVGNLFVEYDRWGYPHYKGFVKQNRFQNNNVNVNIGSVYLYDNAYFYNSHFRSNYRQFREDANFFYYRAVPNAKLGNRNKILKRRKPSKSVIKSNNRYSKNSNKKNTPINSYKSNVKRKVVTTKNNKNYVIKKVVTKTKKPVNTITQRNTSKRNR